ncbi:MAG: hypothetical protein HY098_06765 [Nitrospinae bacterium]|nr:hypothetical protein [Nitrospinota bacterium]
MGGTRVFSALLILLLTGLFGGFFPSPGFGAETSEIGKVVKPKKVTITPRMTQGEIQIVGYQMPDAFSTPFGIGVDKKDNVWFTLMTGNSLGVLNPSNNEVKLYRIPSTVGLPDTKWDYSSKDKKMPEKTLNIYSVGDPGNLTIDKKGDVWFVMQLGNSVVRFEPEKERFTEFLPNKLAYIDPGTKKMNEIKLEVGTKPMGLVVGPDDTVWLDSVEGNYVGKYDPSSKKLTKYFIVTPVAQPGKMIFDKLGKVWFCAPHAKQIGAFYPDKGLFGIVDAPGYNAVPQSIAAASDGLIWYVDSMMNTVGFFNQDKAKWSVFEIPTNNAQAMNLALDSKGDVWYTESDRYANQISKIVRSSVKEEMIAKGHMGTKNLQAPSSHGGH